MSQEIPKEEKSFNYKGLVKFLGVWTVVIGLPWAYFSHYVPLKECETKIQFQPETQTVPGRDWVPAKQGEAEYYSYTGSRDKFKTRKEALNDCSLRN